MQKKPQEAPASSLCSLGTSTQSSGNVSFMLRWAWGVGSCQHHREVALSSQFYIQCFCRDELELPTGEALWLNPFAPRSDARLADVLGRRVGLHLRTCVSLPTSVSQPGPQLLTVVGIYQHQSLHGILLGFSSWARQPEHMTFFLP